VFLVIIGIIVRQENKFYFFVYGHFLVSLYFNMYNKRDPRGGGFYSMVSLGG
jgi:hypothetical protein